MSELPKSAPARPFSAHDAWIGLSLFAASLIVYSPALDAVFLLHDDLGYIANNEAVKQGLSLPSIHWAFTSGYMGNWHPITWLSHMLDIELFGANPRGHHATSILFHALNAAMVYGLLRFASDRRAPSALAAGLFAFHPLHVESVAWIAERKDVLCGFFALLSTAFYVGYARGSQGVRRRCYALSAALLATGLMAKSMLVTLPALFVLLDIWPLRRLRLPGADVNARTSLLDLRAAIAEKAPLFGLVGVMSLLTFRLQEHAGYVTAIGFADRLANAPVSYVRYLSNTLWPQDLSVIYTHPNLPGGTPWSPLEVALAALLIAVLSYGAWRLRERPYLLVGWLWFLGMLVPVIGFIQVGLQAMADRYTYLPGIGLFVAASFAVADVAERSSARVARATAALCAAALLLCASLAWQQTHYWLDTETLFERALEISPRDPAAHNTLGVALLQRGQVEPARAHFEAALDAHPRDAAGHAESHEVAYAQRGASEHQAALVTSPQLPRPDVPACGRATGRSESAVAAGRAGREARRRR